MAERIPLRTMRVIPRKPALAIDGLDLLVRIPAWWGRRRWRVPVADVAVTAFELLTDLPPPAGEVVLAEPLVVPYVPSSWHRRPNVLLVFCRPVPVPRLRPSAQPHVGAQIPVRDARGDRPKGRYVDGLLVRAADPAAAVATLVAAGAERVADPDAWLASRRERATPEDIARFDRLARLVYRRSRLARSLAIGAGAAIVAVLLAFHRRAWAWPVVSSLVFLAITAAAVGWWTGERKLRTPGD